MGTEQTTSSALDARPPLVARLVVVLCGAAVVWGSVLVIGFVVGDTAPSLLHRLVNAAIVGVGGVALVVFARRRLDRRPYAGLALPISRAAVAPLLVGIAAFVVPTGAGLVIGQVCGWISVTPSGDIEHLALTITTLIVTVFVYEALPEELLFRGYVYRNLTTAMAPLAAVLVQSVMFALFGTAIWIVGEGWSVLGERFSMFVGVGIVTGLIRLVSSSVWASVGFHWAFQVTAQLLFGDTMSAEGPILGVAIVPAFVLGTLIVSLCLRRRENWFRVEPDPAA